jgi:hypothetical protein
LCIIFMGFPGKVFTGSKRFHLDTRNGNFMAIFLTSKRGGVKFWGHLWVKSLLFFPDVNLIRFRAKFSIFVPSYVAILVVVYF